MLKGIRKFHNANGGGGGSAVDTSRNLSDPKVLIGEVGEISGVYRDLRARGGIVQQADGSWRVRDLEAVGKLEAMETDVLTRLIKAEEAIKIATSTQRLSGSESDDDLISKASAILQVPEDFGGVSRTHFNLVALKPEELIGMVEVGASRNVFGLAEMRGFAEARHSPTVRNLRRLHQLNDALYLKYEWLSAGGTSQWAKALNGNRLAGMQSLPEWPEYERLMGEFSRAMDETTASKGGSLVPFALSASFQEKMELALRVAALFPQFAMPSKTYDWPVVSGHAVAYSQTEPVFDHATYAVPPTNAITASNPTWALPRWTAKKLASLVFASSEITEDSIVPAIPFLEDDIALALAHSLEEALINGELGANTMDGAVFNPTTETAATAGRQFLNGLRLNTIGHATNTAKVDQGNSTTYTVTPFINLQQLMGVWGVTPSQFAWISGFRGYHAMRKIADFQTMDKIGPRAVNITGMVGEMLGSPVVLTEKLVDLNASGKYDGVTTNRGSVLGVNTRRALVGTRRAVQVDMSEHVAFRSDQLAVRGTWRGDFQFVDTVSATVTPVGIVYNIA